MTLRGLEYTKHVAEFVQSETPDLKLWTSKLDRSTFFPHIFQVIILIPP